MPFLFSKYCIIFNCYPESITMFKYLFFTLLLFVSTLTFAQQDHSVLLKWKLKPGEIITYKTVLKNIDSASSFSMGNFFKGSGADSANSAQADKTLKELRGAMENNNYVTTLTENKPGLIDIVMRGSNDEKPIIADTSKSDGDQRKFKALMKQVTAGVMLRGQITEAGLITSFYLKSDQKNLITALFELPGTPVKVGDSWPVEVNFISMDQNFVCDTSYKKNSVTVISITNINGDQIVKLKYDIVEYANGYFNSPFDGKNINTSIKFSHKGTADFSLNQGRWLDYNCIMSTFSTGLMSNQSTETISLLNN